MATHQINLRIPKAIEVVKKDIEVIVYEDDSKLGRLRIRQGLDRLDASEWEEREAHALERVRATDGTREAQAHPQLGRRFADAAPNLTQSLPSADAEVAEYPGVRVDGVPERVRFRHRESFADRVEDGRVRRIQADGDDLLLGWSASNSRAFCHTRSITRCDPLSDRRRELRESRF